MLAGLGAARGPAEESTFRRPFVMISPDKLNQVLGAWLWTRTAQVSGRLVIAVDGKAVRGAKDAAGTVPHLVAALASYSNPIRDLYARAPALGPELRVGVDGEPR